MSKGHHEGGEKGKPEGAEKAKPEGTAEKGKEGASEKSGGARPAKSKGGHNPLPGGCFSWGCKAQATRFNFCMEHFDHFKFGLIKKTGEHVPDYEKKFEHYMAHKAKKGAQRVA